MAHVTMPNSPGVFLPVGTEFRWREISAQDDSRSGLFDDHAVPWTLSAFSAPGGVVLEVWRFHSGSSVVMFNPVGPQMGSPANDAWEAYRDGTEDWKTATVRECEGEGCDRPLTLHQSARPSRSSEDECPACAARTLLACSMCGMPDPMHYAGREKLLRGDKCFSCWYWVNRAKSDGLLVTPGYRAYNMGDGRGPARGYGGHEWTINYLDGRTIKHRDLWSGEDIPEYARHLFTPNAEVIG